MRGHVSEEPLIYFISKIITLIEIDFDEKQIREAEEMKGKHIVLDDDI